MIVTNYFKAGREIVPFEESSTGAIRLAYTMAASLARRLRAPVSVCYPVPFRGQWADVPAILNREPPPEREPRQWTPPAVAATAHVNTFCEGWCE